jgi:hypothetical protein
MYAHSMFTAVLLTLASLIVPPPDARWQYQLEGTDVEVDVCGAPLGGGECLRPTVIDFDLYRDGATLNRRAVRELHRLGGYAICYVAAGSIERFRPDWPRFRRWHRDHGRSLLGRPFSARFPDERWANVGGRRERAFLLRMMERRVAKCARAGFDGVEFDVVDAWANGSEVTGWDISFRDQLVYNRALARLAHEHGLAAGLKNDLGQVRDLVGAFEFAINEACFEHEECRRLRPFVRAGKPVFHVEYARPRREFCAETEALGLQSIKKPRDLSLFADPFAPCS